MSQHSDTNTIVEAFSDEDTDRGKNIRKKPKTKNSFANVLFLIFSRPLFNKIFKVKEIINVICNPMHLKSKIKHMTNILQIQENLRMKLADNHFGEELDISLMKELKSYLEVIDLSTMSITNGLLSELSETWSHSLEEYLRCRPCFFHDNNEPHFHVVHTCSYSNGCCRCRVLQHIRPSSSRPIS